MNQAEMKHDQTEFATAIMGAVPKYSSVTVYSVVKRIIDIVLSLVATLAALPIILVASVAIKLDSPGPIFYTQIRVGEGGKLFTIYKLRTMVQDAEIHGPKWAEENDPRITRVGRFLRRTRIDELPQLLNIIKGEMSLVGPRPERPEFVLKFQERIPSFADRLQVKPGLTGWAQVNGGYRLSPEDKLNYDLDYINKRSIAFDIIILFKTVMVVLTGSGAR